MEPFSEVVSSRLMSEALGKKVADWSVESPSALMQSDSCIISARVDGEVEPVKLFCKTMQGKRLQARLNKEDEDWTINIASWRNEAGFYRACPTAELLAAGVRIPRPYKAWAAQPPFDDNEDVAVEIRGALAPEFGMADEGVTHFTFLLEHLPPSSHFQPKLLDEGQAAAALAALARFHAFFWEVPSSASASGPSAFSQLRGHVFPSGCWWRKNLRPKVDWSAIPSSFRHLCAQFPAEFKTLDTPENHQLAQWLSENALAIGRAVTSGCTYRTIVHGDSKAANCFLTSSTRPSGAGDDGGEGAATGTCEVTLIDFQWTGYARSGAADCVYTLSGSTEPDVIIDDDGTAEGRLLDGYYAVLREALSARGLPLEDYTREAFQWDYQLEWLDYATTALPYLLADLTPAEMEANRTKHGWLTHEFDARATAWFVARTMRHAAWARGVGMAALEAHCRQ